MRNTLAPETKYRFPAWKCWKIHENSGVSLAFSGQRITVLTTITAPLNFRFPLLIRASCPRYGQVGGSAGREWPWSALELPPDVARLNPQASYQCLQGYRPTHRGRTSPTVHILSISVLHQLCIPRQEFMPCHAMPAL